MRGCVMVYRYDKNNFVLFECIGLGQDRFPLPTRVRRMLGFLLISTIDTVIDALICDAYCREIPNGPKDVTIEEMLENLRRQPNGKYSGQTHDQIVADIIQENAMELRIAIERQLEEEEGRKTLEKLWKQTMTAERLIDYE